MKECCVWGMDCFTRRLLYDCLKLCPELMTSANAETDVQSEFIEKHLLPALNKLGNDGWSARHNRVFAESVFRNLFAAMELIGIRAAEKGNEVLAATAKRMVQLMQCLELREWNPSNISKARLAKLVNFTDNFRAHPKATQFKTTLQD